MLGFAKVGTTLYPKASLQSATDTSKGAIVCIKVVAYSDRECTIPVFENVASIYVKKATCKFPHGRYEKLTVGAPPPNIVSVDIPIPENGAALFRLSGDSNPLHMYEPGLLIFRDPSFAKMAGFEKPILHGLCTYGNIARVLTQSCRGFVVAALDCNFIGHVFPGERITLQYWETDSTAMGKSFAFYAKGSGGKVIEGVATMAIAASPKKLASNDSKLVEIVRSKVSLIPRSEQENVSKRINAIAHFVVEGLGFVEMAFQDGKIIVNPESTAKADFVFKLGKDDMMMLFSGKTSGRGLFMKGKIKISGDMMKSMVFDEFIKAIKKSSISSKL